MEKEKFEGGIPADWRSRPTLDVAVGGAILGLGRGAAYQAVRRGDLPAIRVGGRWRIVTSRLVRMIDVED